MHERIEDKIEARRRARRNLVYLLFFLIIFFASVSAALITNAGHSVFDTKGVLTGAGSFFALLAAEILALILLIAIRVFIASHELKIFERSRDNCARDARAVAAWLSVDVLGGKEAAPAGWTELHGVYRGHALWFEQDVDRVCASAKVETALSFALTGAIPGNGAAPPASYAASNTEFDARCDWQSTTPKEALKFFNQPGVADALLRLNDLMMNNFFIKLENGTLTVAIPKRGDSFPGEFCFRLAVHDLAFLADELEGKAHEAPRNIGPIPKEKRQVLQHEANKLIFWTMWLPQVLQIVLGFTIPALVWLGGSYFAAKWLGMWAGMACFFLPILMVAIFAFTRPAQETPDAPPPHYLGRFEKIPDDEEFHSLTKSYVKRREQTP